MSDPKQSQGMTRRRLLAAGVALSSASLLTAGEAAADSPKVSKACVHFKEVADDATICNNCRLFEKPSTCLIVAGEVSKHNTCRVWIPRIS